MEKQRIDFSLSLDSAKSIPFDRYEKNFTFIVNNQRYETSRYVADLLSPIIRQYHYNDETIDKFTINVEQKKPSSKHTKPKSKDYFSEFLKLAEFSSKPLKNHQRKLYIEYFTQLGNLSESLRLQPEFFGDLSPTNVISRLTYILSANKTVTSSGIYSMTNFENRQEMDQIIGSFQLKKLISFASSHFSEIAKDEALKALPLDVLSAILKDESFSLDEEDTLLDFVNEMYEEDDMFCELYEFVEFDKVSEVSLSKFVEIFNFDRMNSEMWRSICNRLLSSKPSQEDRKSRNPKQPKKKLKAAKNDDISGEFRHEEGREFNGIMRFLSNTTHGNIHDNGTVEITSNSIYSNDIGYHPKNLVDFNKSTIYYSRRDVENATICFDFKKHEVQLSSYTIKSYNGGENYNHLRNWVIEVSNDEQEWKVIDEHVEDSTLRGRNIVATFETNQCDDFYRFVRLRQTGYSWNDTYSLTFYMIEFYGKLK